MSARRPKGVIRRKWFAVPRGERMARLRASDALWKAIEDQQERALKSFAESVGEIFEGRS